MQNLVDNDYEFEESEIELLLGDIGDACVSEDSALFEEFLDDIRAGNAADFFVGAEPAIGSAPATAAAASPMEIDSPAAATAAANGSTEVITGVGPSPAIG